jgi:hypothetical protein
MNSSASAYRKGSFGLFVVENAVRESRLALATPDFIQIKPIIIKKKSINNFTDPRKLFSKIPHRRDIL